MTERPADPGARPYWLVPVLMALLLVPPSWAIGSLVAVAVGATALGILRRANAARARAALREDGSQSVVLGATPAGDPVVLTDRQLSAHGLIVGASGAGKSTTLLAILTDHVRRGRPVVALDMKGSPTFARELDEAAEQAGRRLRIWTPDGPSHWNPLRRGNATELKDKLIATERFTEPHYQRAAERYVQTALQVLQASVPQRAVTLAGVVQMMEPQRLSAKLRHVPRPLAERVQDYLASLTPDQLSAIRGLGTRLAIISESHTGRYLEGGGDGAPTIDLRSALEGHDVVLFSLNSSTYGKLSAQLGALAVQDLISAAGHRLTVAAAPAALVGIDEFSALGGDHVTSLLARGRESGLSVLLATQELADLDRAAIGFRDQVLGNTAVKIAHRQDVPGSALTIAQMAGTEKTWEDTYQIGRHPLFGRYGTGNATRRQAEQFIVHPNEVKTLPTGHAVVITKLPAARARTVLVTAPQRAHPRERGSLELG
jgi:conjugal transfer pilus assembly protein TraD